MATTPVQGNIVTSKPDAGWSDSQLMNWMSGNAGKYYYDQNGNQQQVPTKLGSMNPGQIRSAISNDSGTFNNMSLTDPQAAAAQQTAAPAATSSGGGGATASSYLTQPTIQTGQSQQDIANAYFDQVRNQPGAATSGAVTPQQVMDYYNAANPGAAAAAAQQPETRALSQIAQIDPTTEALRNQLASSYATPLAQSATPDASAIQSYLNMYQQVDPTGVAARNILGDQLTSQAALGSQLDPVTEREIEQATRRGQQSRGNVYGTPQLVSEAMTTGQAGLALQQQRQQALQSYLSSGQTLGDVGLNLYNQQAANLRANQAGALGYLGSGSTPYQTGASYLDRANAAAASAAQGGPTYNPASLGAGYGGTAQQASQYGLDVGQQSQGAMQGLNYGQMIGGSQQNQTGALVGAGANVLSSALKAYGSYAGG
jgi:hypothetical protein